MIWRKNLQPTKAKHVIYLIASTFLGIILSFFVHAVVEMWYLNYLSDNSFEVIWHGGCALPYYLQIIILLAGAIGGFFLGKAWWKLVYLTPHKK
ncbi:MAG: hypothetical protein ABIE68_03505 [bacterium]